MNPPSFYIRCVDELEGALATVPAGAWDAPTPCVEWSARDIAGHVIWGQWQLSCWAAGQEYRGAPGGPGTRHPGVLAGGDVVTRWRAARAAADAALGEAPLDRTVPSRSIGEQPLAVMIAILANDSLVHAWDLRRATGEDGRLPLDLVAASQSWARDNLVRMPGFFGPELAAPPDADEQTRWLAYLGRESPQPARV